MAKILNPFLTSVCSGSIGGVTYSPSRWSTVGRVRYSPVQPRGQAITEMRRLHFSFLSYTWGNYPAVTIAQWQIYTENFFSSRNRLSGRSLSPRNIFFRHALNELLLGNPVHSEAPILPSCSYYPEFTITYTASGYLLTFSPEIPNNCGILVRQKRNLWPRNIASIRGPIVNVLTDASLSPVLISPPANDGGGPGDAPAFSYNSYTHFFVRAVDDLGRSTPELVYVVHAYL